ncbi:MAG: Lrp/AsnC family transcriptional regulator [Dehalococcoidia bacterium]|nr:Lrp/AsnC family transcriptional regulator [Dehalococcoidia bacterium]RLC63647.1 MAG: Lrp/AsnC family transcriptional regulator [Chloroflexota bacterium]
MKEIFEILEQNARATPEQISTMVDKPVKEVEKIIKQAEKDGTIVKYKAIINWPKLGQGDVWALIEVRVAPQRGVGFDTIAERIYQFPAVYSAYLVSGTYDLAILVRGKNMQEISSFVAEKLAPLEQVQSTVTHFLLKRYKENGETFLLPKEMNKRLPITL